MLIKQINKDEYFQSRTKLWRSLQYTNNREAKKKKKRLVTYPTFHNIAAHKWITIRHLCVRLEKKKLHSSKRMMCIISFSHFGIIFCIIHKPFKSNIFFCLKHFFMEKYLAFRQQSMHKYKISSLKHEDSRAWKNW